MKRILPLLLLTAVLSVNAEPIPSGYYDAIDGQKDSLLKNALHHLISGGIRYEYGVNLYHSTDNPPQWQKGDLKSYGTWQAFPMTDRKEDGTIWDMYSRSQRFYPYKQGESACSMNIEHCLPKSWWGGTVNDAYKDLFNLNPSDARANSQKSNYPPGHVQKGDKFDNGSFRMDSKKSSLYGYVCYEPAEEYRGDFARTYFYMATAYEDMDWSANYANYISPASYLMFTPDIVQVLLDWHRADPVSDKEMCRADHISSVQHNRNPFIDYPDLVEYIWGDKKGQPVHFNELTAMTSDYECSVYEPISDTLHCYDTLLHLPAVTAALVRAIEGGYASDKVQSNGTAALTLGTSNTDGWISFSGLQLTDTATLSLRASVYNTAADMQLNIYAGTTLLQTLRDTAHQETRHERYYSVGIPADTDSITICSIGGSTTHRACLQEVYLLTPHLSTTDAKTVTPVAKKNEKQMVNGVVQIQSDTHTFTILGNPIR